MYTRSEIWNQAIQDDRTSHIPYEELEAVILYGVRLEKVGNNYDFYIAYEGDYYRNMPPNFTEVIVKNGWRRGLCKLVIQRCERGIEAHKETLEKNKKLESVDPKTTERLESSIRNLEGKIESFVNQLNSIN